jgi:hypothetical protein
MPGHPLKPAERRTATPGESDKFPRRSVAARAAAWDALRQGSRHGRRLAHPGSVRSARGHAAAKAAAVATSGNPAGRRRQATRGMAARRATLVG